VHTLVNKKYLLFNARGMDIKVMSSISVLDKDVLYIKTENGMKNGRDFTNFGIPLQQIYLFSNK